MATRFYFPTTGTPALSPSFDGNWEQTSAMDRIEMVTSKISSSFASKADSETTASQLQVGLRQYISDKQYQAYSFSGSDTWKLQVRGMEDNPQMYASLAMVIKVIQSDGSLRGVLATFEIDGNNLVNGTLTNRSMSGTCNSVSMQDGDHIMIELGFDANNTKSNSYTGTLEFGDNSGTDLPEDDSSSSQYCPWMELSATLSEYSAYVTLAGASAGSSTSSGSARKIASFSGISQGVATAVGTVALIASLAGVSAGTSTATASPTRVRSFVGQSAGTSTATGALTVVGGGEVVTLAGTSAGTSTSAGALQATKSLSGSAGGVATASGDLKAISQIISRWISGRPIGVKSSKVSRWISGRPFTFYDAPSTGVITLAGSSAGSSTASGFLRTTKSFAGLSAGTSTATGSLTAILAEVTLEGLASGSSTATGDLSVIRSLLGLSAGASTADGFLRGIYSLSGLSSGQGTATGDLTVIEVGLITLAGTAAGSSTADGQLVVIRGLSGLSDGVGTSAGFMRAIRSLVGASAGSSMAQGTILNVVSLAGASYGNEIVSNPGFEIPGSGSGSFATFRDWLQFESGSSTVNDETVDVYSGGHAARLDIDASNNLAYVLNYNKTLVPGAPYGFSFWYKNSIVGKTGAVVLQDTNNNVYLKEDGTWNVGAYTITLPNQTSYTNMTIYFNAHASYDNYAFYFSQLSAASSSIYIDDVHIWRVDDAILSRIRGLTGQSAGASTATAELARTLSLIGAANGSSTADGFLRAIRYLQGVSTGSSTASGSLYFELISGIVIRVDPINRIIEVVPKHRKINIDPKNRVIKIRGTNQ